MQSHIIFDMNLQGVYFLVLINFSDLKSKRRKKHTRRALFPLKKSIDSVIDLSFKRKNNTKKTQAIALFLYTSALRLSLRIM